MAAASKIEIHPATKDRWSDVVTLFGPRGACAGCWCQWPRLAAAEFRRSAGDGNRRRLQKLVRSGSRAGAKFAASQGARILEGYPTDARKRAADAFVWTGLAPTFERAGFREVARRSATRPIMRRALRPTPPRRSTRA